MGGRRKGRRSSKAKKNDEQALQALEAAEQASLDAAYARIDAKKQKGTYK